MPLTNFKKQTKSLILLAYPILIAQLIQNLMGFFDTIMAGRVSSIDLAAVAIANSIWLPIVLSIYGLLMALTTIISRLDGAKYYGDIPKQTYQTAWIALTLGIFLIISYHLLSPIISENINLEIKLKTLMFDYLGYIVWGAPVYCLYLVLRNYAEGLSHTKPTMWISVIGLLINIPANYIFIYGKFGAPALGGAGCGIATALVYAGMFISMLIYCIYAKFFKHVYLFNQFYWPQGDKIKELLTLGIPIAFALLFEVSLFAIVAILLIPFGAEIIASHQIALTFTSLIFMIPLSIGMAVTIKVGFALGNNQRQQAKEISFNAIILGLAIALFTATASLLFRYEIASLYSSEEDVINVAAGLMFLAALYQFSDTIQVISAGALRGYKDTKAILIITFFSYWVIGLGVGVILGLTDYIVPKIGPYGFWIGFISGLTAAAVFLALRLKVVQRRIT